MIDPLGGLPDLLARRVRFVGDPAARIAEDYLRILRFFRFHALYGDPGARIDAEGLAACAALPTGSTTLSRERVGAEMRKLLAAPDPAPAVAAMAQAGVLARVLPGADARALADRWSIWRPACRRDWLRRLAVLGGEDVADRLRLSAGRSARLWRPSRRDRRRPRRPPNWASAWAPTLATDAVLARAAAAGSAAAAEAGRPTSRGRRGALSRHAPPT